MRTAAALQGDANRACMDADARYAVFVQVFGHTTDVLQTVNWAKEVTGEIA